MQVLRFVQEVFTPDYDPTIEDSYRKTMSIQLNSNISTVNLEIVDTAGTEQFEAMRDLYYRSGNAFLVVYAVDRRDSLREAEDILHQIKRVRNEPSMPPVQTKRNRYKKLHRWHFVLICLDCLGGK